MISQKLSFPIETVAVFTLLTISAIAIDLLCHRGNKPVTLRNAIAWSFFWVVIALIFAGYLYIHHGSDAASLFIAGYTLEKALSVDNLFVIMAIFSWFSIPDHYRHRLLYLGVIGAIIFRAIFVVIGTRLLLLGPWMELVFAIIVAFTGFMMLKNPDNKAEIKDYSNHFSYRLAKKLFPSYPKLVGTRFFLTKKQVDSELAKPENHSLTHKVAKYRLYATPLFLCIVVIELTDVMFAFDSVPAIIAVSQEPLIVYSAMIFAILGLRTMYFVLEAMKQYLSYLDKAVICLLFFVAFKLALNASEHFLHHGIQISPILSLYMVLVILALGIIISVFLPRKK